MVSRDSNGCPEQFLKEELIKTINGKNYSDKTDREFNNMLNK